MENGLQKLLLPDGDFIAYHKHDSKKNHPGIVFLGGFMSDMTGTKATSLEKFCIQNDYSFIRFDYFGHGKSSRKFTDCTIGVWKQNILDVLDNLTEGKQILIGSSMGGWLMLLAARKRPEKIAGLIGIAAAPDFTEDLIWDVMTTAQKSELLRNGIYNLASEYGEKPYPITLELIEEGRQHLLLRERLESRIQKSKEISSKHLLPVSNLLDSSVYNFTFPIHLIHGLKDMDVPSSLSTRLAEVLGNEDVKVTLVENGDHRMSTPENIKLLTDTLHEMTNE